MNINDYVTTLDMPILDVMKQIDKNGQGIVYVCDEHNTLCGAITDGDVRRAIIQTGELNTKAIDIMFKEPVVLSRQYKDSASIVMHQKMIRSIPIVDESYKIIDICFQDDRLTPVIMKVDSPVVIMAGGKGTRLQPYTSVLPKPLIPIGNKTITEHIMDRFRKAGCSHFDLIINYKKNFIKSYFNELDEKPEISYYEEEEYLGTAGGLRFLLGKYNESFFMTNCDILVEADYSDIMEFHKKNEYIATIVGAINNTTLPYGVLNTTSEGRITSIVEKPNISSIVNTGFYVLTPDFLDKIPAGKVSNITDVLQSCIDEGLKIGMYPISEERWMDMGQMNELQKMLDRFEGG